MTVRSVSWIFSEGERYGKVTVQGILYNLYDDEEVTKNGVQLRRKHGIFQDATGFMKLTIFSEEDIHIEEDEPYELTNFTINSFNQSRRINSNAASKIRKLEILEGLEEILHKKNPRAGLQRVTNAKIISMPHSCERKYKCLNCKNIIVISHKRDVISCDYCGVQLPTTNLQNIANIKIGLRGAIGNIFMVACRLDKLMVIFRTLTVDDLSVLIEEEVDITFDNDERRIVTICKSS